MAYHLIAIAEVDKLQPEEAASQRPADARRPSKGQREVDYVGRRRATTATIYDGDLLEPGMSFAGPAIIEEVRHDRGHPAGLRCAIDDYGNYHIATAQ